MLNLKYGIATLSVIPVRSEASERCEMVTQLLFGEHFEIIQKSGSWYKIKCVLDSYEGWVDAKMVSPIEEDDLSGAENSTRYITSDLFNIVIEESTEEPIFIGPGCTLPFFNAEDKSFILGKNKYHFYGKLSKDKSNKREKIIEVARVFLNAPYLWGGKSPFGVDCSGLTQVLYKTIGITIPRDASQQVTLGSTLNFISDAKPGDLAFFDNDEGIITHVGLCLGDGRIIHSSGKVRVDLLDHQGIYNRDLKRYSHKLRVVNNLID